MRLQGVRRETRDARSVSQFMCASFALMVFLSSLAASDRGSYFTDEEHLAVDCGGRVREVESWGQSKWNAQKLRVKNGTLVFTRKVNIHGGDIDVEPGAKLVFGNGVQLGTGLGDAATRVFRIVSGAALEMRHVVWNMDHSRIEIAKGAEWYADVDRLELCGGMKDNRWDIFGKATLLNGIDCAKDEWGCELQVTLHPGGELVLGGPVAFNQCKKGKLELVLAGGTVMLVRDAKFEPGRVRLAENAEVTLRVAEDAEFDEKTIEVPASAKLQVVRGVKEPPGLPVRYELAAKYDRTGRSYWIDVDRFRSVVESLEFRYPNPDADSSVKIESLVTTNTLFRRRFPQGKGPWEVGVEIRAKSGRRYRQSVKVARPEKTVTQPTANENILVGVTGYGDSIDLTSEMLTNDLCNLYVGWHSAAKTMGEKLSEELRPKWKEVVDRRRLWSMSIYAGDGADLQRKLSEFFDGRYLGNNCGEYASFMYQSRKECGIPMDLDLVDAKHHFVERYCGKGAFGWMANFPHLFSTCGAALSCYELQGGIDFICNEVWAIGAMNVAHTSAEARGAARKWGPEYWCAWNAHEWQTTAVPYLTRQKFDSCYVGFLEEYIAGTSMMVQESGTQSTQAWQYTPRKPGEATDKRFKEEYDGEVPRRYREVTKKFFDFVKAHPRAKGTPETKIAMALGNLDAYLGQDGAFTVWSQHDRAERDPKRWKYGAPEKVQAAVEDVFFPRPKDALKPFANNWIGGTPYGQVDVMQVDDESRLADLSRYDLLVFGGWNTMTDHVRDVLERYVMAGGTVVLCRAHLYTGVDRGEETGTGKDLKPLFGWLPDGSQPIAEKTFGRGRRWNAAPTGRAGSTTPPRGKVVVYTAKGYPEGKTLAEYVAKIRECAAAVPQSATLAGDRAELDHICYGVYGDTIYLLNTDTVSPHTFELAIANRRVKFTLAPSEFRTCASRSK